MAQQPGVITEGTAVGVSLITNRFAYPIVKGMGAGNVAVSDGEMKALDLFQDSDPGDDEAIKGDKGGVAVVILNSLPTPLTLVDMYLDPAFLEGRAHGAMQLSYPATIRPNGEVVLPHVIPGTRPFPKSSAHPGPQGFGPDLVGGLGVYRFRCPTAVFEDLGFAMAFSCQANGAIKDPMIGLAFYQGRIFSSAPGVNWAHYVLSRVTADLSKEAGNNTQDNLRNLCDRLRTPNRAGMHLNPKGYEANPKGGNGRDVNTKTGGNDLIVNTTLGDSVPYDGAPLIEQFMANITLWVRDSKSWFATDSSW